MDFGQAFTQLRHSMNNQHAGPQRYRARFQSVRHASKELLASMLNLAREGREF